MTNPDRIKIINTPLPGLHLLESIPIKDERGWLERIYSRDSINNLAKGKDIQQINKTLTVKRGTVRGLHFQNSPYTETKIISCIKGKIWDVAVDLRKNSPTFMNYFAVELSENQHVSVLVPEGFAHGFQSLTDNCQIIYFNTSNYNPNSEGGINALDPRISIKWPIEISFRSIRDTEHQYLKNSFSGIEL